MKKTPLPIFKNASSDPRGGPEAAAVVGLGDGTTEAAQAAYGAGARGRDGAGRQSGQLYLPVHQPGTWKIFHSYEYVSSSFDTC